MSGTFDSRSYAWRVVRLTLTGMVSSVVTTIVAYSASRLLNASELEAAASNVLTGLNAAVVMFFGVLLIPFFETVIGVMIPFEVALRLKGNATISVLAVASCYAIGHYANGGLGHAITAFIGGAIFGYVYANRRPNGAAKALAESSCVHSVSNFFVIFVWSEMFAR